MIYRQASNNWGGIGIGFDRSELTQVALRVEFCVQHRYLFLEFALLGVMLDVYILERETDDDSALGPGSGA